MDTIKRFYHTVVRVIVSLALLLVGMYALSHMRSQPSAPRDYSEQYGHEQSIDPGTDVVFIDLPMDNMTWHLPQCDSNELGVVGPYTGRRLDDGRWGMAEMCLPTD